MYIAISYFVQFTLRTELQIQICNNNTVTPLLLTQHKLSTNN